jgi:hypothetical protein
VPDHVDTDAGAFGLEVGHAELAAHPADRGEDHLALLSSSAAHRTHTRLEFPVRLLHHVEEVIHERPGVVSLFVPSPRRLLEGLVVAVFVLFDDPLDA